jgi:hypothetical protein
MSDELGATPPTRPAHYVHYCEHPGCTRGGSFGFAIGRAEPRWFCFEHQPEWNSP